MGYPSEEVKGILGQKWKTAVNVLVELRQTPRDHYCHHPGIFDQAEDSGEAERSFRREADWHSEMIPNTIGA